MSKVLLDMAVYLDGFVSETNGGDGRLHDYFFAPSGEIKLEQVRVVEGSGVTHLIYRVVG